MPELLDAFADAGLAPDRIDVEALSGVDEFHLGGRAATSALVDDIGVGATARVLDVGCGIGGAARLMAHRVGCHVTGVDLTPAFVDAATELSALVGIDGQCTFEVANAQSLPFDEAEFDVATLFHVGMNIADKDGLMVELARVVSPGGVVAVYDIMLVGEGDLSYPMPWASDATMSFLASVDDYRAAMMRANLVPGPAANRLELVLEAIAASRAAPPPVNLGHLMGPRWPEMFGNLRDALQAGTVAPIQILGAVPES